MDQDKKRDLVYVTAALAFILFFAVVLGVSHSITAAPAIGADQRFAVKAAQGGIAEVKLGVLAEDEAASQSVKDFARKMIDDHSKANEKLRAMASKESLNLPADMDSASQATYDRLSKLSGDEFDQEYTKAMLEDHQKDIAEFQKESRDGRDNALRTFATQTLPTVEEHLQLIQQISKNLSAASASI
jgi:putative membrane protein